MTTKEQHSFSPVRSSRGKTNLFDSHTQQEFSIGGFTQLVEATLAEAFPNAGVVECEQTGVDSRFFVCRVGGYELDQQEAFLVAQKAAYDVAERFRLAINMFTTQLNGWSFTLEIV